MLGNKRLLQPFVPSSLDILSNRRPAKLTLYDPLRYGVLSSDDRYDILTCSPSRTPLLYHSKMKNTSVLPLQRIQDRPDVPLVRDDRVTVKLRAFAEIGLKKAEQVLF